MTQTLNIPDHRGQHFGREESDRPVFTPKGEYCGHVKYFDSWVVPAKVHRDLSCSNQIGLWLTSEGHWTKTFEDAERHLSQTDAPTEFFVRGAILGFFVPAQWAEENGTPNTYGDYRVYRRSAGYWDAEEVEDAPPVLASAEYF